MYKRFLFFSLINFSIEIFDNIKIFGLNRRKFRLYKFIIFNIYLLNYN